jgi:hypothetical protein
MSNLNSLVWLTGDKNFKDIMNKIMLFQNISDEENAYILACAILFIKSYEKDRRRTSHFEIGYSIIIYYSVQTGDNAPLFEISSTFGFYPISNFIMKSNEIENTSIKTLMFKEQLQTFEHNGIIETFEQRKFRTELLKIDLTDAAYIAPTSFGKSSIFVDIIKASDQKRSVIIVPTKSLLTQTYRNINTNFPLKKIIFHDEMYDDDEEFIAVFTQERALRLLKNPDISFDLMIIDEAHNVFDISPRSVLLTRLIRRNKTRNPECRTFYFSPLISDADNLRVDEQQVIEEKHIAFNIKEPRLFERDDNGKVSIYNRFLDQFFEYSKCDNFFDYITNNALKNNFVYLRSPRRIEAFTMEFGAQRAALDIDELEQLSKIIAHNVHEDFYPVELVKKGVVYLHGKMPDLIKEYLEYKFRTTKALDFVVANTVILEGVNLPIDNLYILNTHGLNKKALINLIGRVNRLNEVFHNEEGDLRKLLPPVHFVSSEYAGARSNMRNKIKSLKSGVFNDEVKNPALLNYDFERLQNIIDNSTNLEAIEKAKYEQRKVEKIKEREDFLVFKSEQEGNRVAALLIESGIESKYADRGFALEQIENRVEEYTGNQKWAEINTIDKIYYMFIEGLEALITDNSFLRLRNSKARDYYKLFVSNLHRLALKEHINETVNYFQYKVNEGGKGLFYIGVSFGDVAKDKGSPFMTYINLGEKSYKELVNLALVKIKMESDFVSYSLNEYVAVMKDMGVISIDEYDLFIYGTNKKYNQAFTKLGLSGTLINRLEKDNQLHNIKVNDTGHASVNEEFKTYIKTMDDLMQFEISKYFEIV